MDTFDDEPTVDRAAPSSSRQESEPVRPVSVDVALLISKLELEQLDQEGTQLDRQYAAGWNLRAQSLLSWLKDQCQ